VKTLPPEKIELMKISDREVSFLEGADLNRILEAPMLSSFDAIQGKPQSDLAKYRDRAILEMLFSTGIRVSELARLKRSNVSLKKEEFTVMGKGGKSRIVFLSEQARYWLKKYLDARADMNPHLFVSHAKNQTEDEQPLTERSIQRLVQKYARAAGITKPVTPHTLRHSYATDLLQNGADIRSVQTMLGHSSITTTQIYTHLTDKGLRDIHKKFHGKKRSGD
jgi:site-specific recombinase XerD